MADGFMLSVAKHQSAALPAAARSRARVDFILRSEATKDLAHAPARSLAALGINFKGINGGSGA
jgi:hypothetical protein